MMFNIPSKSLVFILVLLNLTFAGSTPCVAGTNNKSNMQDAGNILIYRFGWGASGEGGESKGVHIYQKIRQGLQYHVFGVEGKEIFSSTKFKREIQDGCSSDDIRETWLLLPDTVFDAKALKLVSISSSLVIGTKDSKSFLSPEMRKISDRDKTRCIKALKLTDSALISSICFYSAGVQNNKSRFLVEIPPNYPNGASIAIIEIAKDSCRILFKHDSRIFDVSPQFVCGQADINEDGFCESFAFGFGDYGGVWILTCNKGKWQIWRDKYQPAPC